MQYNYGTSGFRFNYEIMYKIAKKIGTAVALLSNKKNNTLGIMITASHNPYEDNGVKIVNYDGCMIPIEDEQYLTEYVNSDYNIECTSLSSKIVIGRDTRFSSQMIQKLIVQGILDADSNAHIQCIGLVTTPQLHYEVYKLNNKVSINYINALNIDSYDKLQSKVTVDCANGVGAVTMKKVIDYFKLDNISLINTDINNHSRLNYNCGSDYVCTNLRLPENSSKKTNLYASFDGDADRIVFYYFDGIKINLLDGDKISALISYYIIKILENNNINIGVIHTGYSNNNFIKFINSLGPNITTVRTATGVKHLHHEALKYDIGVHFESNGHGTVLFNNKLLLTPQILLLSKLFNPYVGDAIADLFGVLYILEDMNITPEDWNNLYTDNPSKTTKIKVKDKSIFKVTKDNCRLVEPIELQDYIDSLDCFAFARPSGTEDILRLHVESDTKEKLDIMVDLITTHIENNY